ncbi:MAG: hypothetical protein ACE5OR_04560 [bacterium]
MSHRIRFNKSLLWDYDISEKDLENEDVFIFYLSRVLNNGCFGDIAEIPVETIRKYLGRLHLSARVRKFWEWYLGSETEIPQDRKKETQ